MFFKYLAKCPTCCPKIPEIWTANINTHTFPAGVWVFSSNTEVTMLIKKIEQQLYPCVVKSA